MIKFKNNSIDFSTLSPEAKNKIKIFFADPKIQLYIKGNNFIEIIKKAYTTIEDRVTSIIMEILIKSGANLFTNPNLDIIPRYFLGESNLQSIDIEPYIKVIGSEAFKNCSDLKKVNIKGNRLSVIGDYAFSNCHNLEKINFPKSLQVIGKNAFEFCYPLKEIDYAGTIEELKNIKYLKNMKPIEFVEPIFIFENDIIFHCADGDVQYSDAIEMWKMLK